MNAADLDRIRSAIRYNRDTGAFVWADCRQKRLNGKAAGHLKNGYLEIRIFGTTYLAHRLAWIYEFGILPRGCIDHINGVGSDNRICNLREATPAQNSQNRWLPTKANKSSGMLGAFWHAQRRRWRSAISVNGKSRFLGMFDTAEAAHAAYLEAKAMLHPFGEIAKPHANGKGMR